jgi:hypothetical protein
MGGLLKSYKQGRSGPSWGGRKETRQRCAAEGFRVRWSRFFLVRRSGLNSCSGRPRSDALSFMRATLLYPLVLSFLLSPGSGARLRSHTSNYAPSLSRNSVCNPTLTERTLHKRSGSIGPGEGGTS